MPTPTTPTTQAAETRVAKTNLYLIEFYTNNPATGESGWDIKFAWVYATDKNQAKQKLATDRGAQFDTVITCDEQSEMFPLAGVTKCNTANADLFIIH